MNKFTKKLASVAMAATILGTGAAATLVTDVAQVDAAYYSADYNGQKASAINGLPTDIVPQQAYNTFFVGSYIELVTYINSGDKVIDTRMYLKKSDGTLQRYKTWSASNHDVDSDSAYLHQPITTGFPGGTYVAVITLQSSNGTKYQLKSPNINIVAN